MLGSTWADLWSRWSCRDRPLTHCTAQSLALVAGDAYRKVGEVVAVAVQRMFFERQKAVGWILVITKPAVINGCVLIGSPFSPILIYVVSIQTPVISVEAWTIAAAAKHLETQFVFLECTQ